MLLHRSMALHLMLLHTHPFISPSFRSSRSIAIFYPIHQTLNHLIFLNFCPFFVLVILPISFGREAVVENCLISKT